MKQLEEIQTFLDNHLDSRCKNLVEIFGGKHSQAFSYIYNGNKYVLRINISDRGFKKDKFAYDHFNNNLLLIPWVLEIGKFEEGTYFCISIFVNGESARTQFKKGDFTSFSLQFEILEKITEISTEFIPSGFGEWEPGGTAPWDSFEKFVTNLYQTKNIHNWNEISIMPYYEQTFVTYLTEKIEEFLPTMLGERKLVHGDFGNDNFFIQDNTCSGLIDWDKSLIGNHFLDVGRIVLYCPNRLQSSQAALAFYGSREHLNYKQKILFGVYFTMLHNYAIAVKSGMKDSCESSRSRIQEIESVFI